MFYIILRESSYDIAQCSYDIAQCSCDIAQCSYDIAWCSYDVAQCSYDVAVLFVCNKSRLPGLFWPKGSKSWINNTLVKSR
jgi:hypothetical protein